MSSPGPPRGALDTSTAILLPQLPHPDQLPAAYDALIAATAIANGLPAYTTSPDDFEGIDELEVVANPRPDRQV